MAEIFYNSRGTVLIERASRASTVMLSGGGLSGLFAGSAIICTSFSVERKESLHPKKTFSGRTFFYAFGEVPGSMAISGRIFYSDSCNQSSQGIIGRLNAHYSANRAYRGGLSVIAIGGAAWSVILSGIRITMEEGELPAGSFTLSYTTAPSDSGSGGRS